MKHHPLSDSTSIRQIRKARKTYRCPAVWAHDPTIRPGELYARVKLTPGMGCGWREETFHVDCLDPA